MRGELVTVMLVLSACIDVAKKQARSFVKDTQAVVNLSKPMAIVGIVIGGIVVVMLLAGLTGPFFGSIAGINENLSGADTGDQAGNTILGVFPLVIAVGAALGFVGLVLAAVAFTRSRR